MELDEISKAIGGHEALIKTLCLKFDRLELKVDKLLEFRAGALVVVGLISLAVSLIVGAVT